MMNSRSLILSVLTLLIVACSCNNNNTKKSQGNTTIKDSIPACLAKQIETFKKKETTNPPIQVDEYQYKGKRVFLFTADCCDQFNMLYDENCKAICAPSGGFEGRGDHQCEDFSTDAKFVKLIWKKADK